MGNQCCGPSPEQIEQMNKEGRYTKAQIQKAVNDEWTSSNPSEAPTVNKKISEKIVKGSVTALTTFGGTAKFNSGAFNKYFNEYKTDDGNLNIEGITSIVNQILEDAIPK